MAMNERIRQLAEQAGMALKPRRLYDDNEPDGYLESDLDYLDNNLEATRVFFEGGLEKFAELIVGECMTMCTELQAQYLTSRKSTMDFDEKNIYAEGESACDILRHKMKSKFGVEL